MNNDQTLCVIDMQDYFAECANHCLMEVVDEVHKAIVAERPILVIEYWEGSSPLSSTMSPITTLLNKYEHVQYVSKHHDGGGNEILGVANGHNFNVDHIRMVGVNRGYCILQTAAELLNLRSDAIKIDVVEKASWCHQPSYGLRRLRELEGITIV